MSRKKPAHSTSLQLTDRVLADIREVEQFSVDHWGRKTAEKYLNEVALALDRLAENPGLLRGVPDFSPSLVFYRVGKHYLVCSLHGEMTIVLTLMHASMDIPERLAELEPRLLAEAQFLRNKLRRP